MQSSAEPPQQASPEPRKKARPALHLPAQAVVDRNRPEAEGLRARPFVAGLLHRIVVELHDLFLSHAVGRQPGRNMDIAEPLDVGEHLVGTGPGDGAGGCKGVAGQNDAGAAMTGVDVKIGWPDFNLTRYRELACDPREPRQ